MAPTKQSNSDLESFSTSTTSSPAGYPIGDQDRLPFVTVIMPVLNEAPWISRSLLAVLNQDYPRDHVEIIVADGLSSDGTRETILQLCAKYPRLRLIDNHRRFVAAGLNGALRIAKGDVIIRVDGHCEVAPDYVSRCVRHLQKGRVQVVGGPLTTVGTTPLSQTIAVAMSSWFGVGGSAFRTRKNTLMLVDTVAFPAFARAIIQQGGLFDEELVRNQDDEYNYRLRKLGAKILLAGDIRVRYYARSTLLALWRQYFQYGYWKVRVMQKHPRQMSRRQFVPPSLVLALIVTCVMLPFFRWARPSFLAIGVSYLVAVVTASVMNSLTHGWRHFANLAMAFATLHLSYGLGFLTGLIHFVLVRGLLQFKLPSRSAATE